MKHRITHIEISAQDREKAKEFYSKLFGWEMIYDEAMDYLMFQIEPGYGGAFAPVSENNPAGTVLIYVETESVDDSLATAESMGAQVILPTMEIPGVGRMGVFLDLTGNKIALFQRKPEE